MRKKGDEELKKMKVFCSCFCLFAAVVFTAVLSLFGKLIAWFDWVGWLVCLVDLID